MRQQTYGQVLKSQGDSHHSGARDSGAQDSGAQDSGARGIALGILLSLPLWAVIFGVGYWWLA